LTRGDPTLGQRFAALELVGERWIGGSFIKLRGDRTALLARQPAISFCSSA
jgi:hypothetical protein